MPSFHISNIKYIKYKGKHLLRSKIEINGSILEQVKQFNYLGCEINIDGEPDFDKKKNMFQRICGTIRKHLKKTRTDTQMKFYKIVARPAVLYGSETWVTTTRDMTRLEAAEMRFLRGKKTCVSIYLTSVVRYKFVNLVAYIPGTLNLREKRCEDAWLFF